MRRYLGFIAASCFILGVGLLAFSSVMPAFSDQLLADAVFWGPSPSLSDREAYDAFARDWHEQMDALRTSKYIVQDVGSVFLAIALSLTTAMMLLGSQANPKHWQTLKKRWHYVGLWAVFVALVGAEAFLLIFNALARWEVPPWGDSAAIPLAGLTSFLAIFFPASLIVGFIHAGLMKLPSKLFIWRSDRTTTSRVITAVYGGAAVFWSGFALLSAFEGLALFILAGLLAAYLSLCTRAGLLANLKVAAQAT